MRLYNTLTRQLDDLPAPPGPVRMYVCGPTVYARAHVGNARPFVIAMWLRAWLRHRGYDVTLVHNITDINDKIYVAANAAGESSSELAARAAEWYVGDVGDLGLGLPDVLPKATESVPQIVQFIEELVGAAYAYAAEGDVYFRVARYADYGQLSRQRPDEMQEEEQNSLKEDPRDFALWKATKPGEDTSWDSPWGRGRPGWHIECSVMAEEELGRVFEIHGGGLDLVFPHHENELAQSRALGHPFAQLWMHNGLLQFTGAKMSKSDGDSVTIRDAIDRWGAETLLLFFMTGHWRKPLDFSEETMAQAAAQVQTFRDGFGGAANQPPEAEWDGLVAVLDDDFNTPDALRLFHDWRRAGYHDLLRRGLDVFGLGGLAQRAEAPSDIVELAEERREARGSRDWTESDRLRDELAARGWDVRDEDDGYVLVPRP